MPGNGVTGMKEGTAKTVLAVLTAFLTLAGAGGFGWLKLANQQEAARSEFLQNSWTVEDMLKYSKLVEEKCGCHIDPLDVLWEE